MINNNEKNILPTLKSRCLNFKINFTFNESVNICNQILNKDIFEEINHDLISYYYTAGEMIDLFNFSTEKSIDLNNHNISSFINLIIEKSYYKKDKYVKNLLINFIELFFLKEYRL